VSDVVTIKAFGNRYRIINPGPGRVGTKLAHGEPYERKLLVDCYQQGLSGTAFDVGAHIGNHSLYLGAICGFKVHAWEPHDESRRMLQENLALNPHIDVTVHDWAAGAEHNRGRFTRGMWLEFDPTREGDKLTLERGHVQVHRIDDHLDVPDLAVVKIDVEGMEADVISGAAGHIERSLPVIYSETHTDESHASVATILEPLGYEMTRAIHMGSTMERWQHKDGPR
jgi:FkbM family methyltransferase